MKVAILFFYFYFLFKVRSQPRVRGEAGEPVAGLPCILWPVQFGMEMEFIKINLDTTCQKKKEYCVVRDSGSPENSIID